MSSDYVDSFESDDKTLVFRFFVLFSRFECALKECGFRKKRGRYVEAAWDKFAASPTLNLDGLGDHYLRARGFLMQNPPMRQTIVDDELKWVDAEEDGRSDGERLFDIVRQVRNNLFHGGKFRGGPVQEVAHDRDLVDSATTVLEVVASLNPAIGAIVLRTTSS